jgi:hypothetical protein
MKTMVNDLEQMIHGCGRSKPPMKRARQPLLTGAVNPVFHRKRRTRPVARPMETAKPENPESIIPLDDDDFKDF